jgi:hypothetical protein
MISVQCTDELHAPDDRKTIIALCLVVLIFLLALELFCPGCFLYDDNAVQFLPFYHYDWQAVIEKGTVPLINFHQFMGCTYLGQGQTGVLYPPVYGAVALSRLFFHQDFYCIDILVISHLMLAALFMFLLLRKVGAARILCVLGAILWVTSPFILLLSKSWVFVAYTAAFAPLDFLAILIFLEKPSMKNSFFLALIRTLFFFQGYVQYMLVLCAFETLFFIALALQKKGVIQGKTLAFYCISYVETFFLSSVLFFPMAEAQKASAFRSSGFPFEYFVTFAMSLEDFFKAQVYLFQARIIRECKAGSQIYYTGIFIFLPFLLLLKKSYREAMRKDMTLEFIIMGLLALISTTFLYGIFYKVPVVNLFKGQFKFFIFFVFFLILSSSLIASRALKQESRPLGRAIMALFVVTILSNMALIASNRDNTLSTRRVAALPEKYLSLFSAAGPARIFTCWLKNVPQEEEYMFMTHNMATLFGLYHFMGYGEPLLPRMNLEFGLKLAGSYGGPLDARILDHLSFWGVRYLVMENLPENRERCAATGQLRLIYGYRDILVFENTRALPLVYSVVNDEMIDVPFEMGINGITIYPRGGKPCAIVASIIPLPGYHYRIDNGKAEPIRAGIVPLAVSLPPGVKRLTLFYRDPAFAKGATISIVFLALCTLSLLIGHMKKRYKRGS